MKKDIWNITTDEKFQKEWELFQHEHSTEDYKLLYVFDIYLPFWQVKQDVFVEKEMEDNRFTKILLRLIDSKIKSRSEICSFLGIEEDNFCVMQLDFLTKLGFIREIGEEDYEITHEGLSFLEDNKKLTSMEKWEFEFMMVEKAIYLKSDQTGQFFDPQTPFDAKQLTDMKKDKFSGYKILESHKIRGLDEKIQIEHKNYPTRRKLVEQRNEFSCFFNNQHKDATFYDFADNEIERHRRNICFLAFLYENENNPDDRKIDIRQSERSVLTFDKHELERTLSKQVTEYVLKNVIIENKDTKDQKIQVIDTSDGKYCHECGTQLNKNAKFCIKCGEEQETVFG
ncbi:MAG: zinc ribbon domain-containing protein [Bacteroidales bacterium]|jgi:predicted transcriptional regulator|nr:zinc ribbon domain-containing protein [Bacteroidales bacterium]